MPIDPFPSKSLKLSYLFKHVLLKSFTSMEYAGNTKLLDMRLAFVWLVVTLVGLRI